MRSYTAPNFGGLVPALFLLKPRQSTVTTDCYASREILIFDWS